MAATNALVCPLKLLQKLKLDYVNYSPDLFYFRGFNGRLVAKNPHKTTPYDLAIKYAQYMRYLSLWFGSAHGLSTVEFKTQYGSQSSRIGAASSSSNAGIPVELWGQHGDWVSLKSQNGIYIKRNIKSLLSVSLAAMDKPSTSNISTPMDLSLDVRIGDGISNSAEDNSISFTERIPSNICLNRGNDLMSVLCIFARTISHRSSILFLSHGTVAAQ